MDQLKRVSAVLGAAFGSLAMLYLVFACSLTRKNFGLSVEDQLVAQRVITPLVFVAFGALAVSCEYFRRVLLQSGIKAGIFLRILRLVAVVVLPAVIVIFTLKTPFWSFKSPSCWDRPQFFYGWFLPCKVERTPLGFWLLFLNLFLWTFYLMVLVGYRRIKHYLIMLGVMLVLFGLYAKFGGINTVYRGRRPQSKAQSSTAQLRGFCHTARAFGQKEKTTKSYNVHKGMSNKKQNAACSEVVVKNFDRIRLRPHRFSFKTLH